MNSAQDSYLGDKNPTTSASTLLLPKVHTGRKMDLGQELGCESRPSGDVDIPTGKMLPPSRIPALASMFYRSAKCAPSHRAHRIE